MLYSEKLQFGDVDAKQRAIDVAKMNALQKKQVDMVVAYFCRFVPPEFWPGVDTMRSQYPKPLRHLRLSVLREAARILIEMKPA